ncbi:hypothetical protein TNCV_5011661 [Trichonephila clavipes]|nr:hypothetical protein TNCV_5011661 [Trichonephila clavipes]
MGKSGLKLNAVEAARQVKSIRPQWDSNEQPIFSKRGSILQQVFISEADRSFYEGNCDWIKKCRLVQASNLSCHTPRRIRGTLAVAKMLGTTYVCTHGSMHPEKKSNGGQENYSSCHFATSAGHLRAPILTRTFTPSIGC